VNGDWSEPLSALRGHWGEAYVINYLGAGRWTAERRDTQTDDVAVACNPASSRWFIPKCFGLERRRHMAKSQS